MDFNIETLLLSVVPLLLAITIHELAHGWVAYKLGDHTAKLAGRLTLNPLKHLDPIGTLVLFLTQRIGWAKPVPVNPYNLRHPRRDMVWVAAAGVSANLIMAVGFSLVLRALLDWYGITRGFISTPVVEMAFIGLRINLGLAVFNLLPIPPLDGSNILMGILPRDLAIQYDRITPYGFIILLVLIFTNFVSTVLFPIINGMAGLLLRGI